MNLNNYYPLDKILKNKTSFKKIFFYRVCGTGMGAAACLLREAGYDVHGGDSNFYPPMSDYLKEVGIPMITLADMKTDELKKYDLIVVGNVVGRTSTDARQIEESGIPFCSFPAALGGLVLCDFNVIGIAGTHGKTTTTYFCSQVFRNLGMKAGHFVGGVIPGENSAVLGDGKYFFIESDEYDSAYFEKVSKFHFYQLDDLILTSLEFDHADIFKNLEEIKVQFRDLLKTLKKNLILCAEYPAIKELAEEFKGKTTASIFYGEGSGLGPDIESMDKRGTNFKMKLKNEWVSFQSNVTGKHNIQNLSTAILLAYQEGFAIPKIKDAIKELKMVKRREEFRGLYRGAKVIDDFAHHPRAVSLVLDSVRLKNKDRKLVTVLEANSATGRTEIFQKEFAEVLLKSDQVLICKPPRDSTISGIGNLDVDWIAATLSQKKVPSKVVKTLEELRSAIDASASPEVVFIIMSNGTCLDLWKSSFVDELKE
jgi:UDP-N-acetylmuramate: L-alanyl-gamma-D-glutamyl-meso-diaminopimelate ligase